MSARCGEFLKDCHWASLWEGPCSCVTDNLKLSYSCLFSWKMNMTETEAILGCTYTPCHYLPAALFCLRSHVIYLFVQPTPCMFLLSLCRLHGCSRWWQIPAIFCSLQVYVVSSYVTAADLLRIYRLNAIYLLTWPQQTHVTQLCFWIGREWQPLTGIQVTNQSIWNGNWVNVWLCVERSPLLHLCPDVCLPLFPDNGRRDFIRCLHPSSSPLLQPPPNLHDPLYPTQHCPLWFQRVPHLAALH